MRILSSVVLSILLVSSVSAAPPERFEPRGPGAGGALFEPSYNPRDPAELWLASDMSQYFTTRDAGVSWRGLPFSQIQGGNRTSVRFTRDKDLLWAIDATPRGGADSMRPAVSLDGGRNWQRLDTKYWPESTVVGELFVDFDRPERLLVSAEGALLFFSPDAGRSFRQIFEAKRALHLAGAVFTDTEILACTSHDGLLRSLDNGKTWREHPAADYPRTEKASTFVAAGSGDKRRLFLVTVNSAWQGSTGAEADGYLGMYVLDPGANRWRKAVTGLNMRAYFVAASPRDAEIAYAAGRSIDPEVGPAVFKTIDGGKTWQNVFRTAGNANIATGWAGAGNKLDWTWPEFALGLAVAPSDPDRVAVTDLGCVHQTKDGGKTWEQIYTTPTTPHPAGKPTPKEDRYTSRGLEVTSCWDLAWLGPKHLFAGYSDISGSYSTDGGKSWAWPVGHTENSAYQVLVHPDGKSYLAGSSVHDLYMATYLDDKRIDAGKGYVKYSDDQGATWKMLKDFDAPVVRLASHPGKPEVLLAAVVHSQRGGIYRTDDLSNGPAARWTRLAEPPGTRGHPYSLHLLADGTLVCTYSGHLVKDQFTPSSGVYVSIDGGKSWDNRSDPGMRYWTKDLVIDPHDPKQNTWYVCVFHAWGQQARTGRSGLYRSFDRGKTWKQILQRTSAPSEVLNVESVTFHPTRPGEIYLTTEYDGLWWTDDLRPERPTFRQVEAYPFRHPTRVFFNPHQVGEVWVTSFGGGLFVGRELQKKP